MYLSRVEIDLNNRQKTKDLIHLGAYHNWVEQSFPEAIQEKSRPRNLWRIDTLKDKTYLIVLSNDKPDPSCFSRYGVEGTEVSKSYDQFLNSLTKGQHLRFRLTANPTYSVITPGEKRGKVYPHITIRQQKEWLIKKSTTAGFQILKNDEGDYSFNIVSRDQATLRHTGNKTVRLSRVSYEGLIEITDIDKFKDTLIHGVGREKAYGMGLMTVIPVK
ncbi:type I-E CRISPR-associated protein Cas6/Cse3/CasE [Xylocopilactobacillus apis]|uniref:Type I-E CRISPR-associated protein Cas6/Cse3/CasE n=1 Tax=Xylocopilactobacillus apis TaxID=2932183 RepID=A0AAU9CXA9_9LACO|nr:type I-E CRISPR-associated protein Cas6/Cse3/CasE [Xylocopilactobacillus apis]BDR57036.1 type I-E CRISPR-associated protein Cas6/Cse3/CasE [Xylocopilactobacillus apis]